MKHPGYARFHDRLSSFVGWKGPEAIHMAASGFFYTGLMIWWNVIIAGWNLKAGNLFIHHILNMNSGLNPVRV